jgi:hypothetical protein
MIVGRTAVVPFLVHIVIVTVVFLYRSEYICCTADDQMMYMSYQVTAKIADCHDELKYK